MKTIKTAPRISDTAAKVITDGFSSLNAGCEYILNAWPALFRRTIHGLKREFERGELKLMVDIFNASILTPGIAGQHLIANCEDGIELDGLDKKWEIDKKKFLEKIHSLTIFEAACLEIWANGFWYGAGGKRKLDIDTYVKK
jgi:hypothetical protein